MPSPVIYDPSCSGVASVGSSCLTSFPSYITYNLSESPRSSSQSAEISKTPRPISLASLSLSQINAWAPISTPLVG